MRALLLALLFPITTLGCGRKTDPNVEPAKPSTEAAAMNVREGSSAGSSDAGPPDKLVVATPPPPGYTGGSAAQDKATEDEQAKNVVKAEENTADVAAAKEAVKTHKIVQDQVQSAFDASDRRFTELKEKADKATGSKKQKAAAAVADLTKREAVVMAAIAKLRDGTGTQWDKTKTQLDTDSAAFTKALDALDVMLR